MSTPSRASVVDPRSSTRSADRRWITISLGLALASAVVAPAPASARSVPQVVINEVLYDAVGTDTGQEWIELFNAGAEVVDLADWRFERAGTAFAPVHTIPRGTTIAPQSFLLIGESSVEDADVTATLAFQNGGSATDGIRLVDDHGAVVDVLLYDTPNTNGLPDETGSAGVSFAPDVLEGRSLGRVPDGTDTNASSTDFRELAHPTPGQPNAQGFPTALPTPSSLVAAQPTGVVVNEVLPNPVGNDAAGEFIELFNSLSTAVDLGGALLDDGEGGSSPYTIPTGAVLPSRSFRVFPQSETKIVLNNDGDTARLLGADGTVISTLTYQVVPREGAAWARRDDGSAAWTLAVTAGVPNAFTSLSTNSDEEEDSGGSPATARERKRAASTATFSPTPSTSPTARRVTLADARVIPLHTRVVVTGTVAVPPNILGRGVFYLADGAAGLMISVSGGDPLSLVVGDRVHVEGFIGSVEGEVRLRTHPAEIQRLGGGNAPVPEGLGTGDVGPALAGTLVRIRGTVVRISGGSTVWVDDGSGPLRVVVRGTTGFERPALRRGQHVTVVGVVSLAGEDIRLLPRFREDFVVGGIVAAAESERPVVPLSTTAVDESERAAIGTLAAGEPESASPAEMADRLDGGPSPTDEPVVGGGRTPAPKARRLPVGALLSWGVAAAVGIIHLLTKRS